MKTLFLYTVQFYLFCSCTCIFGVPQPRHSRNSSSKLSNGESSKKCQDVNVDLAKNNFLDQENLLCFGLKVFSQRFRGGLEETAAFDGVEKKSETDICKYFQEMRLNPTQDQLNETVDIYNMQFQNKVSCERACLDVRNNVNPLCNVILLLSRHSEGNGIRSDIRAASSVLSGDKVGNDNNEVSAQARTFNVPNKSLTQQNTKASVVEQNPVSSTHEETLKGQKLDEGEKSVKQNTKITPPAQTSQGIKSSLTHKVDKLPEQAQQTDLTEIGHVKGKLKATNEERTLVTEGAKEPLPTSDFPAENVHITPNNITASDTSKKITNSKKESKVSNVEDINSVDFSNNESSLPKKEMLPYSVILPEVPGFNQKQEVTSSKSKLQTNISTVKDNVTPKKIVPVTDLKEDESISLVPNDEVAKGIGSVNGQKSPADNKETENPVQNEAEIQTNSKMITEVIPKSDTDEQKTNQNNGKADANENAETVPQSAKTDTQKTDSYDGRFTDDKDDLTEPQTHFSEAGELPDNTEVSSGGGTSVYYASPDSDDLETDKNDMENGAILIHERYDEDDDSHFFAYFMTTMVFCIVGYLLFHNKQKILALALEGRARRGRRRPNTSGYRKLDSNLEEAISSSKSASVTQVIY